MRRQQTPPAERAARLGVALSLLALAAWGSQPSSSSPARGARRVAFVAVAAAQGAESLRSLEDEYAKLERDALQGNANRRLSYIMLQPYLPPGTRMTSGYRGPQYQLDLIVRYARGFNIPVPANVSLHDESSWRPVWAAVRARGIIIASPTTTPHSREEAVFDLSGPDLDAIHRGLLKARDRGLITYKNIIVERQNHAVHVEVGMLDTKLLNNLVGLPSTAQGGPQPSEADQRGALSQQMRRLHDGEPDPAKRIDYDRAALTLLDPAADAAAIARLEEEIGEHQREAELLGSEGEKRDAVARISEALRDDRPADAERDAVALFKKFPDYPQAREMLVEIRTRRLVLEATGALEEADCGGCEKAGGLVEQALALSPAHQGARLIREEAEACAARCRRRNLLLWSASALLVAGIGGGLYYLALIGGWLGAKGALRGAWSLEVLEGPGAGAVFSFEKERIVIGSQGPPEGSADFVIADDRRMISRRHCTLVREGGQVLLIDESTNGTSINGRAVSPGAPTACAAGDRISLGDAAVLLLRES